MANTKIAGVDVLLKIKEGSNTTPLGGQKGASLSRSAETIDVSDKNSNGWAESMVGLKSWGVECEGFVVLEDTALATLHEAFENRTAIEVEIKVGGNGGYTYTGKAVITDFPEEYDLSDCVTYSISLMGASPLVRTSNSATLEEKAKK